jgi:transposase-like protein
LRERLKEECKFCGSECLRKEGLKGGTQRYRCKSCKRVQIRRDNRKKYGEEEKRIALKLYTAIEVAPKGIAQ